MTVDRQSSRLAPTAVYCLNAFNSGGAESGLLNLIEGGLFEGCDLRVVSLIRGTGEIADGLTALGVTPQVLVEHKSMNAANLLVASWKLGRLLRRERPDVLILSLPQANIIGRVLGTIAGISSIVSFEHNSHLAKPIYEKLFRLLSPLVDVIFADCEETAEVAKRRLYWKQPRRTFVVPLTSFEGEPPSTSTQSTSMAPTLASVGRLTKAKNHEVAVKAMALLRDRGRIVNLEIMGEGERRTWLLRLVKELGLEAQVLLPGFVPEWWTRRRFDGFLLTSRHEGLCIAALEAMWAGIPVIAPAVGGLRDYGTPENMIAIDDLTPEYVAEAIEALLGDPSRGEQMRAAGRATVADRFSKPGVRAIYAGVNREFRGGFTS